MKRTLLLALIALCFAFAAVFASTAVADGGDSGECERQCQLRIESCEVSCPPESDTCYKGCFDTYVECLDACES